MAPDTKAAEIAAAVAEGLAPVAAALEKLTARVEALLGPMEAKTAAEAEATALKVEANAHLESIGASEKVRGWFTHHATNYERLALLMQLTSDRLERCAGGDIDFKWIPRLVRLDEAIEWERQNPELVAERERQRLQLARKRKPRMKR